MANKALWLENDFRNIRQTSLEVSRQLADVGWAMPTMNRAKSRIGGQSPPYWPLLIQQSDVIIRALVLF
jgi:hypothetical protein